MSSPASPSEAPLVLVAEADPALRDALKFALELTGFRVETFDAVPALLQRRLPERGACLVLNQSLPNTSGLDGVVQLRRRGSRLPAVVLVGQTSPLLLRAAAAAGATVVEMPLVDGALEAAIRQALAAAG